MNRPQLAKLSRLINGSTIYGSTNTINKEALIKTLADWLASQLPYFDKGEFIKSCNGEGGYPDIY